MVTLLRLTSRGQILKPHMERGSDPARRSHLIHSCRYLVSFVSFRLTVKAAKSIWQTFASIEGQLNSLLCVNLM